MNKNYYDILEINRNASPEIIEKAYKTLAKKYHPDLQDETNKKASEEILKQVNEAYDTLSDPVKKRAYDENLNNTEISNQATNSLKDRLELERQIQNARQQAYHDAYIKTLKNKGYKIRYKKTFKDYFKNLLALIITILILLLLFQIPFIKNFFINLYNDNILIHSVVDFFKT